MHPDQIPLLYAGVFFVWGACAGSFANVVVYRLPREESVVDRPSACPHCGTPIRAFDLIPVLSWFLLRGRCRACRGPVSFRYPAVEAFTGLLCGVIGYLHAENPYGLYVNAGLLATYLLFAVAFLIVTLIDMETQIIPDEISLGGLIAALPLSFLLPPLHPELLGAFPAVSPRLVGLMGALLGAAVGGGSFLAMRLVGAAAFRRQIEEARKDDPEFDAVIGWGDVKLMAMAGAILGWKGVLAAMFLAVLGGSVYGSFEKFRTGVWPEPAGAREGEAGLLDALLHRWRTGVSIMPFGPFLSGGALVVLIFRAPILAFFESLFA